jgi:Deacetylase PdaC/Protein of unknown function (DUF3298)
MNKTQILLLLSFFTSLLAAQAQKNNASYYHLTGNIGNIPVTVDLVQTQDEVTTRYYGNYTYDKFQEPIQLYGYRDSTGHIALNENTTSQEYSTTLYCNWWTTTGLQGVWKDGKGKNLPINLHYEYPRGSYRFNATYFSAIEPLFKERKEPKNEINATILYPFSEDKSPAAAFLKKEIAKHLLGDSLMRVRPTKTAFGIFEVMKQVSMAEYTESQKDVTPKEIMEDNDVNSYSYTSQNDMSILWNKDSLLSIGFYNYSYTGGAHGNYGTATVTYDLKKQIVLTYDDVFTANSRAILTDELEKAYRKKYSLSPKIKLEDALLAAKIEPNDNFCLTGTGVLFTYSPYEIASYAEGEIQLFIPFKKIEKILRKL